jgi:hypothetical protein
MQKKCYLVLLTNTIQVSGLEKLALKYICIGAYPYFKGPHNTLDFFFFSVLGLELRAFTVSPSSSPVFVKGFSRYGLKELFDQSISELHPPDLCLLSS